MVVMQKETVIEENDLNGIGIGTVKTVWPTRSSHHPHSEPLSGTMLAPSSLTKVAVHIVYTKRRESTLTLHSYGVTAVD